MDARKFVTVITAFLATYGVSCSVAAHGGGLDGKGCHTKRSTGEYHCHRSPATPSSASLVPNKDLRSGPATSLPDDTCYTGPRGGRYRIVNGKKRYGC